MKLNDYYVDRGIKKYFGFFLSEHTTKTKKEAIARGKFNVGKDSMTPEQITETINYAILKDLPIAIQLNFTLGDNHGFPDDLIGKVRGFDDRKLWLSSNDNAIYFDVIRNVETTQLEKWFK